MEDPLERLIDEVRLLWNSLVRVGEELHAGERISIAQRAVLEFLLRNGPTTVPNLARRRRVTRQHVQTLVNELLAAGLVERRENPDHRRSVLICLTSSGSRRIERMKRREAAHLAAAREALGDARIRRAGETLAALRSSIER